MGPDDHDTDDGDKPDLSGLHTAEGPAPLRRLAPGEIFAGRYRIEALIGEGGSGSIYRVFDRHTEQDIALKLIRPDRLASPAARSRLVKEAITARRIRHPNVVAVYDTGEADGLTYLTMEFLPGQSLRAFLHAQIHSGADCSFENARAIIAAILDGLEAAHAEGVIHRDLKPENVFLLAPPENGRAKLKLIDFGIALSGDTDATPGAGTARYRAPEQITSPDLLKPSADLYALSVMFYELLVGVLPQGMWQPPSQGRSDVPEGIDKLIQSGLAAAPRLRPQTTADYRKALDAKPAKPAPEKNTVNDGWTPDFSETPEPAKPKSDKPPLRAKVAIDSKETAKQLATRAAASLYSVQAPEDLPAVRDLHLAAAEKGDAGAMAGLSFLLLNGWGGQVDIDGALNWARKTVAKGIDAGAVHAQFTNMALAIPGLRQSLPTGPVDLRVVARQRAALGEINEMKAKAAAAKETPKPKPDPAPDPATARMEAWVKSQPPVTAADIRKEAAKLYNKPNRSAEDLAKARDLYEMAAKDGDTDAMRILGYMLHNGLGGPRDSVAAHDWFFRGAVLGDAGCMSNLGFMLADGLGGAKQNREQALSWYRKAADKGDKDGIYNLALALQRGEGTPGGKPDAVAALDWFRKLAETGDARGMFNYGENLMFGRAGKKDAPTGREWLRKAAEAGHRGAQTVYGLALAEGLGGPRDNEGSRTWLLKAAERGDETAMRSYAQMLEGGHGGAKDLATARAWYQKAVTAGDLPAVVKLAAMMVAGEGGPKDKAAAKALLKTAADKGDKAARDYLNSLW